jgi:calcineurin-like phosphoesterase family protein
MREGIIFNWNNTVTDSDTVVIAGDLSWCRGKKAYEFVKRLNGHKILVRGNHDYDKSVEFEQLFDKVVDYLEIEDNGRKVVVCHYPMPFYRNHRHGWYHVYAHLHTGIDYDFMKKWIRELNENGIPCKAYNAGCMLWNYTPVTLDQMIERGV